MMSPILRFCMPPATLCLAAKSSAECRLTGRGGPPLLRDGRSAAAGMPPTRCCGGAWRYRRRGV